VTSWLWRAWWSPTAPTGWLLHRGALANARRAVERDRRSAAQRAEADAGHPSALLAHPALED
jgi:hypothetical protein